MPIDYEEIINFEKIVNIILGDFLLLIYYLLNYLFREVKGGMGLVVR